MFDEDKTGKVNTALLHKLLEKLEYSGNMQADLMRILEENNFQGDFLKFHCIIRMVIQRSNYNFLFRLSASFYSMSSLLLLILIKNKKALYLCHVRKKASVMQSIWNFGKSTFIDPPQTYN